MGLKLALKLLVKALPVILAHAPALVDAVQAVRKAMKSPEDPPAPAI
jgi:hypothetical protein